jgi:diacylglycerol kinase family enzyme
VAITFKTLKVGAILHALGGALRGGGMKASAAVDVQTDLSCLSITSPHPFPFQVDGDYLGETTELRFEHRPNAARLVYPSPA